MKRWIITSLLLAILLIGTASADTTIELYPSGDSGLVATGSNVAFTILTDAATAGYAESPNVGNEYVSGSSSNTWNELARYIFGVNLSTIPGGATITGVTVSLSVRDFSNDFAGTAPTSVLTNASPTTWNNIVVGDFGKVGSTILADNLTYSNWSDGGRQNFTGNAAMLSYVQSRIGSNASFAFRTNYDVNRAFGGTFATGTGYNMAAYGSAQTGTVDDPVVSISYTISGGEVPVAGFSVNVTNGTAPLAVAITDSSVNATSWTYTSKNYGTYAYNTNREAISTLQSPVMIFGIGNFSVNQTAGNAYGTDEATPIWINVTGGWNNAPLPGTYRYFPDDNIWNVNKSIMPLTGSASTYINGVDYLGVDGAALYMAVGEDSPITVVNNSVAGQLVTIVNLGDDLYAGSDHITYPIPGNVDKSIYSDNYILLTNNESNWFYELYDSNQNSNGTWWAEGTWAYNSSSNLLHTGTQGTGVAGLPVQPGLLRYDEVASGFVNHTLYLALPTSGNAHVWPARSNGNLVNTSYPPMGQIFRLSASKDISGYTTKQKVILTALKKYGMILGDNSGAAPYFMILAVNDARWDNGTYNEIGYDKFTGITLDDFEAINVSSLMISESSGQANTTAIPGLPVANFTANVTSSPTAPLVVKFTDTSTGVPTSWLWNMSDGPGTLPENYQQSPVWSFWTLKQYTISLTVTNAFGSNTTTKTNYILVGNGTAPVAHFLMSIYTGTPTSTPTPTPTPTTTPDIPDYGAPASLLVSDAAHGISGTYALGGSYYGGGTQYPAYTSGVDAVSAGGSTYNGSTISTKAALLAALTGSSSGDVIFISPSANIDMTNSENIAIPANVTIASNRGVSGSAGGRIYTKTDGSGWGKPIFRVSTNNVRFTGLRLEGEAYPEASEGDGEATYRVGVWVDGGTGFVVDNCDLYGFAYGDIYLNSCPTSGRPWIHHNYIHGSQNLHEGYGVNVGGGDALIEGNVFDRNRHSITGDGEAGEMYTARYNYFTDTEYQITGMANIDVHERSGATYTSGSTYLVYSNTFAGGSSSGVHQRGKPTTSMTIYKNIFNNYPSGAGWTSGNVPVYQSVPSGYTFGNMVIYDNYVRGTLKSGSTGVLWEQTT
ncbi:MAG: PKD domain-containing protein [Methanoregula sp.]|nr:PKD domain-containing protein [Methanoregula sp.]